MIGNAEENEELYYLEGQHEPKGKRVFSASVLNKELMLRHYRIGHPSFNNMSVVSKFIK